MGGVFGLSSIAGPLLGGWFTDNASWRWVFYVNIPLGLIAMAVLAVSMPKIVHDVKDRSIDYLGAVLLTTGLVPLLLALVWGGSVYDWGSWQILAMLAFSLLSLLAFVYTESRVSEPVLAINLFHNRVFLISVIALFLTAMAMFGAILYIPIFAQGIIGASATNAGLILTPMMLSLVVASTLSGQLISKTGKYKMLLIIGTVITVVAMALFSRLGLKTTNTTLVLRMILLGLGLGSTMPIFTIAVQSAFPKERLGEVTAGTQLFRSIGGSVGTAVLGGLMNAALMGRLTNIRAEPFVQQMAQINLELAKVNGDNVQQMLNPMVQQQVTTMIAGNQTLMQSFTNYLTSVRSAFSFAVDHVFIATTAIMVLCLIAVFFMPEVPLRRKEKSAIEEMGLDLDAEFGNAGARHQPKFD
jgi:EmrB/QacA subfamily drug resistance transporter